MLLGGLGYMILELLFRGHTHWTMGVTGGLCFVALYLIEIYSGEVLWRKCVMGALVITTIEFLVGIVVNLILGWKVWDYSKMPFHLLGQICPLFTVLWLGVSAGAMKLIRYVHNRTYKTEQQARQPFR